jgi:hypothetical protein
MSALYSWAAVIGLVLLLLTLRGGPRGPRERGT